MSQAPGRRVADFNTLDDLISHARGEGATHVLHVDDEVHLYFKRRDGSYEKSEVWQKDGYWHTQGPGSRVVVQKPPSNAKPIESGLPSKAKSLWKRAVGAPRTVRDYEAIDRRDRVIAGPFKRYSDAKDAAGPAGAVRFVPKGTRKVSAARGGSTALKRQQRSGSFVVTLSTGQTARFHDMPRAQEWATERLKGQPAGTYAAFYRAAVGPDRSDTGAPWTEPFHMLVVDEYGHVRVGDTRTVAPLPAQHPHRTLGRTAEAPRVLEDDAEAAGAAYAQEQLSSENFLAWVAEQLVEASKMPPDQVLPLETKSDAKKIARNMLQQLEWDTRQELGSRESAEFYKGFRVALDGSRDWLAEELLTMNQEISGVSEKGRVVKDIHSYDIDVFFRSEGTARKFEKQLADIIQKPLVSQGALKDGYRLVYGPIEMDDYRRLEGEIYKKVGNAGLVRLVQNMYAGGEEKRRRPKAKRSVRRRR
jgi:hypothetical protein